MRRCWANAAGAGLAAVHTCRSRATECVRLGARLDHLLPELLACVSPSVRFAKTRRARIARTIQTSVASRPYGAPVFTPVRGQSSPSTAQSAALPQQHAATVYGQSIMRFHASRRYTSRKKRLARADRERFPGIISISEATYGFALTDTFTNAIDKAAQDADAHRASRTAAPNAP